MWKANTLCGDQKMCITWVLWKIECGDRDRTANGLLGVYDCEKWKRYEADLGMEVPLIKCRSSTHAMKEEKKQYKAMYIWQHLGQTNRIPGAKITLKRSPVLHINGQALINPPCSVIGWDVSGKSRVLAWILRSILRYFSRRVSDNCMQILKLILWQENPNGGFLCLPQCVCVCVHTYIHIHTHIHTYGYIHICTCIWICVCIYTHTCIYRYTCIYKYIHIFMYIYRYIYTYVYVYIYTHVYMKKTTFDSINLANMMLKTVICSNSKYLVNKLIVGIVIYTLIFKMHAMDQKH